MHESTKRLSEPRDWSLTVREPLSDVGHRLEGLGPDTIVLVQDAAAQPLLGYEPVSLQELIDAWLRCD